MKKRCKKQARHYQPKQYNTTASDFAILSKRHLYLFALLGFKGACMYYYGANNQLECHIVSAAIFIKCMHYAQPKSINMSNLSNICKGLIITAQYINYGYMKRYIGQYLQNDLAGAILNSILIASIFAVLTIDLVNISALFLSVASTEQVLEQERNVVRLPQRIFAAFLKQMPKATLRDYPVTGAVISTLLLDGVGIHINTSISSNANRSSIIEQLALNISDSIAKQIWPGCIAYFYPGICSTMSSLHADIADCAGSILRALVEIKFTKPIITKLTKPFTIEKLEI